MHHRVARVGGRGGRGVGPVGAGRGGAEALCSHLDGSREPGAGVLLGHAGEMVPGAAAVD